MDRVKGRMIYCSSADRGLDVLLNCLPEIRKVVPEAHVRVFYGFNTWELAVLQRKNPQEISLMQQIKSQLKQPGVEYHGRIGQNQLAKEFMQAELWGYPTYFWETFCLSACEAMAAGVPIVTSRLAALATTVGDAGILIDGDSRTLAYQQQFVSSCVRILTDPNLWLEYSKKGKEKVEQYSWGKVGDQWLNMLGVPK